MNHLKSAAVLLALSLSAPLFVFAQESAQPAARKIDEFIGEVDYEDLIARLDNFAVELQSQPNSQAHIIVYRGRRDPPGISHRLALTAKDYMLMERGISPDRVATFDGGMSGCLTYELWLVPAGATSPDRRFTYRHPKRDPGSAYLFDTLSHSLPLDEVEAYPNRQGANEYLDAFAAGLKAETGSRGYIIVYAQYCADCRNEGGRPRVLRDPAGAARDILKEKKNYLVRKHHVNPSKVITVDGGYRTWRVVELWIAPRGAHAPVPTPNQFPGARKRR